MFNLFGSKAFLDLEFFPIILLNIVLSFIRIIIKYPCTNLNIKLFSITNTQLMQEGFRCQIRRRCWIPMHDKWFPTIRVNSIVAIAVSIVSSYVIFVTIVMIPTKNLKMIIRRRKRLNQRLRKLQGSQYLTLGSGSSLYWL